jgi:hypothetical protein
MIGALSGLYAEVFEFEENFPNFFSLLSSIIDFYYFLIDE